MFPESLRMSIPGKSPMSVPGDGNCFFNSLSVALVGNLSLVDELRVRTCMSL